MIRILPQEVLKTEAFQYPCHSMSKEILVKGENQSYSALKSILTCFQVWTTSILWITCINHSTMKLAPLGFTTSTPANSSTFAQFYDILYNSSIYYSKHTFNVINCLAITLSFRQLYKMSYICIDTDGHLHRLIACNMVMLTGH